jgi:hypothetical protein
VGMLFNRYRHSVLQDKSFRDCLHSDVNILNTAELYT